MPLIGHVFLQLSTKVMGGSVHKKYKTGLGECQGSQATPAVTSNRPLQKEFLTDLVCFRVLHSYGISFCHPPPGRNFPSRESPPGRVCVTHRGSVACAVFSAAISGRSLTSISLSCIVSRTFQSVCETLEVQSLLIFASSHFKFSSIYYMYR